jgi:hypothetical protein
LLQLGTSGNWARRPRAKMRGCEGLVSNQEAPGYARVPLPVGDGGPRRLGRHRQVGCELGRLPPEGCSRGGDRREWAQQLARSKQRGGEQAWSRVPNDGPRGQRTPGRRDWHEGDFAGSRLLGSADVDGNAAEEPLFGAANRSAMATGAARARAEGRREAAPAAFIALLVFVVLAVVSWGQEWELLGLSWWTWLLIAVPLLLLTIDLSMTYRGEGLVRSRRAALLLLGLLALGNFTAVVILVAGLVTSNSSDLSGGELLFTGFAIWSADVIVFGLWFWEVEAGGPAARLRASARTTRDFQFPQDADPQSGEKDWRPQVWDYLYVSLTNSIAFSPTDTMPLSLRAKAMMGFESAIAAITVLLVAARAVNVLGS